MRRHVRAVSRCLREQCGSPGATAQRSFSITAVVRSASSSSTPSDSTLSASVSLPLGKKTSSQLTNSSSATASTSSRTTPPPTNTPHSAFPSLLEAIAAQQGRRVQTRSSRQKLQNIDGTAATSFVSKPSAPRALATAAAVPPSSPPLSGVTITLVEKLLKRVRAKQIAFEHLPGDIHQLELYSEGDFWMQHYFGPLMKGEKPGEARPSASETSGEALHEEEDQRNSCTPSPALPVTPVFVSAASTGSGKSLLTPLWLLHTHWQHVERRLERTRDVLLEQQLPSGHSSSTKEEVARANTPRRPHSPPATKTTAAMGVPSFDTSSLSSFTEDFQACSRVCIVVTQPTRLACVELSKFVTRAVAIQSLRRDAAENTTEPPHEDDTWEPRLHERCQALSHSRTGRIGYAVSGSSCYSPATTEIVFATTGFTLMSLSRWFHHQSGVRPSAAGSSSPSHALKPTMLVVDEAHDRQFEMDLLLTWVRVYRSEQAAVAAAPSKPQQDDSPCLSSSLPSALRGLVVLSATLSLSSMYHFLSTSVTLSPEVRTQHSIPTAAEATTHAMAADRGTTGEACGTAALPSTVYLLTQAHHRGKASEDYRKRIKKKQNGMISLISEGTHLPPLPLWDPQWWCYAIQNQQERYLPLRNQPARPPQHTVVDQAHRRSSSRQDTPCRAPRSAAGESTGSSFTVEQYFLDDLPDGLSQSPLLCGGAAPPTPPPSPEATASGKTSALDTNRSSTHHPAFIQRRQRLGMPLFFSDQGRKEVEQLRQLFHLKTPSLAWRGGAALSMQRDTRHYKAVAVLLLRLLEVLQWRWGSSPHSSSSSSPSSSSSSPPGPPSTSREFSSVHIPPPSLLVFLPGMAEIHQVMRCLEVECVREASGLQHPRSTVSRPSSSTDDLRLAQAAAEIPVFQYSGAKELHFSVVALHRATVGTPQDYLAASERLVLLNPQQSSSAAHPTASTSTLQRPAVRLLLATSIAESSITIPHLRAVVDLCMDRVFVSDTTSGTTRKETTLVSHSGLWQRRGRAGRTCDGVVLHLASRSLLQQEEEALSAVRALATLRRTSPQLTRHHISGPRATPLAEEASAEEIHRPPAITEASEVGWFPPLPDSAATILLRTASAFPFVCGTMIAHLPSPPPLFALQVGVEELKEKGLWKIQHHAADDDEAGLSAAAASPSSLHPIEPWRRYVSRLQQQSTPTSTTASRSTLSHPLLTFKGLLIASLPLPLPMATLIFHGLQFHCVEDAVLLAAAMTVPSLYLPLRMAPTMVTHREVANLHTSKVDLSSRAKQGRQELDPLYAFIHHLAAQRRLAGHPDVPDEWKLADQIREGDQSPGHFSEPLIARDVLRGWYVCASPEDAWTYIQRYQLHRGALRQVDWAVYQCCTRLLQLLPSRRALGPPPSKERLPALRSTKKPETKHSKSNHDETSSEGEGQPWWEATPSVAFLPHELHQELFGSRVPPALLPTLHASLSRLQHAARMRALRYSSLFIGSGAVMSPDAVEARRDTSQERGGSPSATASLELTTVATNSRYMILPQWYPPEKRYASIFQAHYLGNGGAALLRWQGKQLLLANAKKSGPLPDPSLRCGGGAAAQVSLPTPSEPVHPVVRQHIQQQQCIALWSKPSSPNTHTATTTGTALSADTSTSLPPVCTYVFGAPEDRLCAAFIASFASFTLQGEDNSHRPLHRRLIRNTGVLDGAEDETCGFSLELQLPTASEASPQHRQPPPSEEEREHRPTKDHPSFAAPLTGDCLTPSALQQALEVFFPDVCTSLIRKITSKRGRAGDSGKRSQGAGEGDEALDRDDPPQLGDLSSTNSGLGLKAAIPFRTLWSGSASPSSRSVALTAIAIFQRLRQGKTRTVSEKGPCPNEDVLLAKRPIAPQELLEHSPYVTAAAIAQLGVNPRAVSLLQHPSPSPPGDGGEEGETAHTGLSIPTPPFRLSTPLRVSTVQLPPFGISVLWSAWGLLQRVPVRLQLQANSSKNRIALTNDPTRSRTPLLRSDSKESAVKEKHSSTSASSTGAASSSRRLGGMVQLQRVANVKDPSALGSEPKTKKKKSRSKSSRKSASLPAFTEVETPLDPPPVTSSQRSMAEEEAEEDWVVSWTDNCGSSSGVLRQLHLHELKGLGLEAWFPTEAHVPPPTATITASISTTSHTNHEGTKTGHDTTTTTLDTEPNDRLKTVWGSLSITGHLYVSKGIRWWAQLPSPAMHFLQTRRHEGPLVAASSLAPSSTASAVKEKPSGEPNRRKKKEVPHRRRAVEALHCPVCFMFFSNARAMGRHCATPLHLHHLSECAKHRIHADEMRRLLSPVMGHKRESSSATTSSLPWMEATAATTGVHRHRAETTALTQELSSPRMSSTAGEADDSVVRGGGVSHLLFPLGSFPSSTGRVEKTHKEEPERRSSPLEEEQRCITEATPCFLHPHSFLNVLQWTSTRNAPLAVAGGLRAVAATHSLMPSFTDGDDPTLPFRRRPGSGVESQRNQHLHDRHGAKDGLSPSSAHLFAAGEMQPDIVLPSSYLATRPTLPVEATEGASRATPKNGALHRDGSTAGMEAEQLLQYYTSVRAWCAQWTWVLPLSLSTYDTTLGAMPSPKMEPPVPDNGSASACTAPQYAATEVLVLAGYLAAATRYSCLSLLVDAAHEWVFGFRLVQRGGVWKLPVPVRLRTGGVVEVLQHMTGAGDVSTSGAWAAWPGLLHVRPAEAPKSDNANDATAGDTDSGCAAAGRAEGLHWCSMHRAACAERGGRNPSSFTCTAHNDDAFLSSNCSAPNAVLTPPALPTTTGDTPSDDAADELVHSTLLLVLQEILLSSRNMVPLVDYVERVLAKLRLAYKTQENKSLEAKEGSPPSSATATPVALLLNGFLDRHYPEQSLVEVLRLVGCRFALPSRTAALREHVMAAIAAESSAGGEAGGAADSPLSFSTPAVAGDFRFTLPPILPSRLPPKDFVARLEAEVWERRVEQQVGEQRALEEVQALRSFRGTAETLLPSGTSMMNMPF